MSCIELAPELAEDFDRILDHLTNHEVEDPGQRIGEIIAALEILVQNPLIGRLVANAKRELVYGLEKWAFEVQRHGAAKDPKTTYSILPERQLTAEERKSFQAVELLDLPKLYAGELEKEPESEEAAPEGPIDPKLATAIVTQLKATPCSGRPPHRQNHT